ncbi:(2Fe-2S)-binding protein [Streptomyces jumonjinensis]|uniref:Ferric iron reductase n=1 Tax=Streptomyces jumonjinensis TaxID=1945 RepID=A0A646KF35_STRJU|nr:(2Fe-2S)-binding protein [Streptomyces jumonjinensis]MQT00738.1 ferric iron reductase [Streptomyces jumonjinensis]
MGAARVDLRELCALGGFFALRTSQDGTPPSGDGRSDDGDGRSGGGETGAPLARLYAGDLTPLTLRVDIVVARHTPPERRVAASIAQLGLAARLWSIALGAAALCGGVPALDPERLHWSPGRTAPDDLWLDTGTGTAARLLPATAESIRETVQYAHLVPLADALRRDTPVSRRLLWGNAGSALAGAVRQLDDWARKAGRGDVAERAAALAAELFAHPDLSATVRGPGMRRNTCCLYYRAPRGGLCGDCVFDRPPGRTAH